MAKKNQFSAFGLLSLGLLLFFDDSVCACMRSYDSIVEVTTLWIFTGTFYFFFELFSTSILVEIHSKLYFHTYIYIYIYIYVCLGTSPIQNTFAKRDASRYTLYTMLYNSLCIGNAAYLFYGLMI